MEKEDIRDTILDVMVTSLEAQLRALKRLRGASEEDEPPDRGKSQVDIAYDILKRAGRPLHVSQIIEDVEKMHGKKIERESIVSALTKKVVKGDRFVRAGKNTFALKEE